MRSDELPPDDAVRVMLVCAVLVGASAIVAFICVMHELLEAASC